MNPIRDQLDFNFVADDLLELPRDLSETGYFQFSSERRQAIRALSERFGIALNQRVRLRLHGQEDDLEGTLMLDALLLPSPEVGQIALRLGNTCFENTDIQSCTRLD